MRFLILIATIFIAFLTGCSEYPHDFATTEMEIFNLKIDELTASSARLTWETSKKGSTEVYYKRISSVEKVYLDNESDDGTLDHVVILKDLAPQEDYFCRIISRNDNGYMLEIDDVVFTTNPYPQVFPEEPPLY
jgi:hypothetical protein